MGLRRQVLAALALAAAPLLLGGCREGKVTEYTVPKEKDPELPAAGTGGAPGGDQPSAPAGAMAGAAVPTASGAALTWTAPPSWVPRPGSPMRKASFAVPGAGGSADLSVTAFPGDVGGELANINRWRGQVGLPPLPEEGLPGAAERFQANGLSFAVVDLASSQGPKRLLGAIVPFGDGTWFFKLIGPDPVVSSQKQAFLDFLKTVKPASAQ